MGNFADVGKPTEEVAWAKSGPTWRYASKGLNTMGRCRNEACQAYEEMVVHQVGCNKAHVLGKDASLCPACGEEFEPFSAGFTNCQWRAEFCKIDSGKRARGTSDWRRVGDQWNRFQESGEEDLVKYSYLKIETKDLPGGTQRFLLGLRRFFLLGP